MPTGLHESRDSVDTVGPTEMFCHDALVVDGVIFQEHSEEEIFSFVGVD